MCKLLWVEELLVVTEIPDDVFNVPDEVPEYLDVCLDFLFTDIEVRLVLAGQMLDVFGSFVDVIHAKVTGS
jgi:hypothetical protein